MKITLAALAIVILCSACSSKVAYISPETLNTASNTAPGSMEYPVVPGEESRWATTPDGFPVW